MKNLKNYPLICLFAAFILVFAVADLATPDREHSELENIFLARPPTISLKGLMDSSENGFAQKYEKYTNEQFLFRDGWITLKSVSESMLLKVENNGIIYGEHDYMFDKYKNYDTERYERNVKLLEDFATLYPDYTKTLLLAPSAYAVMPDRLPLGLGNVNQMEGIASLTARLEGKGWESVDIAGTLYASNEAELGAKPEDRPQLYYRTDHHWTTRGAYEAYSAYATQKGLTKAKYTEGQRTLDFYGTHYSKSKSYKVVPDSIIYCEGLPIDSFTIDGVAKDGMYDTEKLSQRDKYASFLYGNNGVTVIENSGAPTGTVMVIKDSFANCFVPFLTQSYSRVVVIDLRSMPQKLSEIIEKETPDEIILLYNFKNVISDSDLPRIKY